MLFVVLNLKTGNACLPSKTGKISSEWEKKVTQIKRVNPVKQVKPVKQGNVVKPV